MSRNKLNKLAFSILVGNLVLVGSAAAIPDPAYVFCLEMGYVVEDGCCVFPDGSSCELWAFLRGECGEEYVHPVPCAEAGEQRGVAVECCEGLVEISNAYPEDHVCHHLLGAFPLCSACGDENCDDWENSCNCPEDCGPCVEEGGTIPVVADPPVCCAGLELIPPMYPDWYGIHGYCTANCGDGVCDPQLETAYNCPEDCPCVGEGGTIPVIADPPVCCAGLELIPPMYPDWYGIHGYCTANCGDGVCDPEMETDYNCPEDCPGGGTEGCFAGCGVLGRGPQICTMFHADSGESFAVENTGGFWIGDHVYVAGLIVEDSLMCWPASVPAIENNSISACFTGCGVVDWHGPQGCTLFRAGSGEVLTLDSGGDFTHGDRPYVTGPATEDEE